MINQAQEVADGRCILIHVSHTRFYTAEFTALNVQVSNEM